MSDLYSTDVANRYPRGTTIEVERDEDGEYVVTRIQSPLDNPSNQLEDTRHE